MRHDEARLQRNIILSLERTGFEVLRMNAGSFRRKGYIIRGAPKGTPDLLALLPGGRCIWIEVKLPGQEPEPHQVARHDQLRSRGQLVAVVDNVQQAVMAVIRAAGRASL